MKNEGAHSNTVHDEDVKLMAYGLNSALNLHVLIVLGETKLYYGIICDNCNF